MPPSDSPLPSSQPPILLPDPPWILFPSPMPLPDPPRPLSLRRPTSSPLRGRSPAPSRWSESPPLQPPTRSTSRTSCAVPGSPSSRYGTSCAWRRSGWRLLLPIPVPPLGRGAQADFGGGFAPDFRASGMIFAAVTAAAATIVF
uniref:Proline-rich receptor-like protein kinase PERK9 n=1 Tax=Elaeis guineensis var. tenera TaxID=51953 RepID=A0A6J0PI02_ELAGV|nr:proline-rich receptor-like protein kinase PERK9 [Elaeis guineensis]